MSHSSQLWNLRGVVVGTLKFAVSQAEVWVAPAPHLCLVSEVETDVWDMNFRS